VEGGASQFDFGRSPRDAGTYRFKVGWGATERPLLWERTTADGRPLKIESLGESSLMQRLSGYWTRMPAALTDRLGPQIRKRISN
jgi:serine/alanine adding enzyme